MGNILKQIGRQKRQTDKSCPLKSYKVKYKRHCILYQWKIASKCSTVTSIAEKVKNGDHHY